MERQEVLDGIEEFLQEHEQGIRPRDETAKAILEFVEDNAGRS